MAKVALLAGALGLPQAVAQACDDQKKEIFVLALKGFADPAWVRAYPHAWVRLGQAGKIFRLLQQQKCTHLVLAGALRRPAWWNLFPDWEGVKLFWRLNIHRHGDDSLLRRLTAEFETRGYHVLGADTFLRHLLMPLGPMTKQQPSEQQWQRITQLMPRLKEWALADKGQAAVVMRDGSMVFEDAQGTDALIKNCSGRGGILVKIKKPQQDRRFDLPTIGESTIEQACTAGFEGIAVEAAHALFLDQEQAIAWANEKGIFVVGIETP